MALLGQAWCCGFTVTCHWADWLVAPAPMCTGLELLSVNMLIAPANDSSRTMVFAALSQNATLVSPAEFEMATSGARKRVSKSAVKVLAAWSTATTTPWATVG